MPEHLDEYANESNSAGRHRVWWRPALGVVRGSQTWLRPDSQTPPYADADANASWGRAQSQVSSMTFSWSRSAAVTFSRYTRLMWVHAREYVHQ